MTEPRTVEKAQDAKIEFAAAPPGALTWTPAKMGAVPEDRIVREAFRFLALGGGLSASRARDLGRAMGLRANGHGIEAYLDAFSHLGLGRLTLERATAERYVAFGHALEGSQQPHSTTCALALGFIEGAVAAAHAGEPALGTELQCRSRGDAACSFFVRAKR